MAASTQWMMRWLSLRRLLRVLYPFIRRGHSAPWEHFSATQYQLQLIFHRPTGGSARSASDDLASGEAFVGQAHGLCQRADQETPHAGQVARVSPVFGPPDLRTVFG